MTIQSIGTTGLSIDTDTGRISGTPATVGTIRLNVTAQNSFGFDANEVSITVNAPNAALRAPELITASLPEVRSYDSFSFPLQASGSLPMTWEIVGGNFGPPMNWSGGGMPNNTLLDKYMGYLRSVGGAPLPGTYSFTVKVINDLGSDEKTISLTVNDVGIGAPDIKTTMLPAVRSSSYLAVPGQSGYNYSDSGTNRKTWVVARGATPMTWSITGGSLPSGLSLNPNTGEISGRPAVGVTAGAYNFTVRVSNSVGNDSQALTINVVDVTNIQPDTTSDGAPVILNRKIPDMTVNGIVHTHSTMESAGGNRPITWTIDGGTNTGEVWTGGGLPAGISLNGTTGIISGTVAPSVVPGEYFFIVQGTNSAGSDRVKMSVTISPDPTKVTTLPRNIMGPMIATYQGPNT
jgi:hypothetical protein